MRCRLYVDDHLISYPGVIADPGGSTPPASGYRFGPLKGRAVDFPDETPGDHTVVDIKQSYEQRVREAQVALVQAIAGWRFSRWARGGGGELLLFVWECTGRLTEVPDCWWRSGGGTRARLPGSEQFRA